MLNVAENVIIKGLQVMAYGISMFPIYNSLNVGYGYKPRQV